MVPVTPDLPLQSRPLNGLRSWVSHGGTTLGLPTLRLVSSRGHRSDGLKSWFVGHAPGAILQGNCGTRARALSSNDAFRVDALSVVSTHSGFRSAPPRIFNPVRAWRRARQSPSIGVSRATSMRSTPCQQACRKHPRSDLHIVEPPYLGELMEALDHPRVRWEATWRQGPGLVAPRQGKSTGMPRSVHCPPPQK